MRSIHVASVLLAIALGACSQAPSPPVPPASQAKVGPAHDPGDAAGDGYPVAAPAVIAQTLLTRVNPQSLPLFSVHAWTAALDASTPVVWALPRPAAETDQTVALWQSLLDTMRRNPQAVNLDAGSAEDRRQVLEFYNAPDLRVAVEDDAAQERAAMWCGVAAAPVSAPSNAQPNRAYAAAIEQPVRACAALTHLLLRQVGTGPFADPSELRARVLVALEGMSADELAAIWRAADSSDLKFSTDPALTAEGPAWSSESGQWQGGSAGWLWRSARGEIQYGTVFLAGKTPELRLRNLGGGRNTAPAVAGSRDG